MYLNNALSGVEVLKVAQGLGPFFLRPLNLKLHSLARLFKYKDLR